MQLINMSSNSLRNFSKQISASLFCLAAKDKLSKDFAHKTSQLNYLLQFTVLILMNKAGSGVVK